MRTNKLHPLCGSMTVLVRTISAAELACHIILLAPTSNDLSLWKLKGQFVSTRFWFHYGTPHVSSFPVILWCFSFSYSSFKVGFRSGYHGPAIKMSLEIPIPQTGVPELETQLHSEFHTMRQQAMVQLTATTMGDKTEFQDPGLPVWLSHHS